jgi:hypothetical protein
MNKTAWTRAALGLIVVGAIAASGCSSEDTATSVRTSAHQVASSTTEPEELSIQERASRSWKANEPQGVVDGEGNEVGFFSPAEFDAAAERLLAEKAADGNLESSELTHEQRWAYFVLSAVDVHDEAGDLTGYFADGFYTPEEYAEAVARAEPIVAAAKAARR